MAFIPHCQRATPAPGGRLVTARPPDHLSSFSPTHPPNEPASWMCWLFSLSPFSCTDWRKARSSLALFALSSRHTQSGPSEWYPVIDLLTALSSATVEIPKPRSGRVSFLSTIRSIGLHPKHPHPLRCIHTPHGTAAHGSSLVRQQAVFPVSARGGGGGGGARVSVSAPNPRKLGKEGGVEKLRTKELIALHHQTSRSSGTRASGGPLWYVDM